MSADERTANQDHVYMQYALTLAREAEQAGEVPVGAVVVGGGQILGRGSNTPISAHDPSAHAEINAIRDAARRIGNYRLVDTTLYVTLEPCCMCAGAIVHARIKRVVFGADDLRAGAVHTKFSLLDSDDLNHRCEWRGGIEGDAARELLQEFFARRRKP